MLTLNPTVLAKMASNQPLNSDDCEGQFKSGADVVSLLRDYAFIGKSQVISWYIDNMTIQESRAQYLACLTEIRDLHEIGILPEYVHILKQILPFLREAGLNRLKIPNLDLSMLHADLYTDEAFISQAIMIRPDFFQYVSEALKKDIDFMYRMFKKNPNILQYAPACWDNLDVMQGLNQRGLDVFRYAPECLSKNRQVMLQAIKDNPSAFKYASISLKRDKSFILELIEHDAYRFSHLPRLWQDNATVMLAAIKKHPDIFECASPRLKKKVEFLLKVIEVDAFLIVEELRAVSKLMKLTKEKIEINTKLLEGMTGCFDELSRFYASGECNFSDAEAQTDLDAAKNTLDGVKRIVDAAKLDFEEMKAFNQCIALAALKKNALVYQYLPVILKEMTAIALAAVIKAPTVFSLHLVPEFVQCRTFICQALAGNGLILACVPTRFKQDKEVVLIAIRQNIEALKYAAENLQSDSDVLALVNQAKALAEVKEKAVCSANKKRKAPQSTAASQLSECDDTMFSNKKARSSRESCEPAAKSTANAGRVV